MTAEVVPARGVDAGTADDSGESRVSGAWTNLRSATHAEWTKFRTVAGMLWLAAAAVLLTIGLGLASDSAARCPVVGCHDDPARISYTGVLLGQALVAVLATLAIGAEYSSGMIRTSLSATPRRLTGLAAKTVVVGAVVLGVATVAVVGSLIAGRLILPGRGFTAANASALPSLTDGTMLRATLGSILYLCLIGLMSLGIAYAVRDSVAAIGIVLGLLYLFPIVAQVISDPTWHKRLEKLGPMTSGQAVQTTRDIPSLPITPWHGLGVVALWALGALLAGAAVLRTRDA